MADLDIDEIERIAKREVAAQAEEPTPETFAARLRSMGHHASTAGSATHRRLDWIERKARRVLHEIRQRRAR